jgi:hypothetical protein
MSLTRIEQIEIFIKKIEDLKKQIDEYSLRQFVIKKIATLKI